MAACGLFDSSTCVAPAAKRPTPQAAQRLRQRSASDRGHAGPSESPVSPPSGGTGRGTDAQSDRPHSVATTRSRRTTRRLHGSPADVNDDGSPLSHNRHPPRPQTTAAQTRAHARPRDRGVRADLQAKASWAPAAVQGEVEAAKQRRTPAHSSNKLRRRDNTSGEKVYPTVDTVLQVTLAYSTVVYSTSLFDRGQDKLVASLRAKLATVSSQLASAEIQRRMVTVRCLRTCAHTFICSNGHCVISIPHSCASKLRSRRQLTTRRCSTT